MRASKILLVSMFFNVLAITFIIAMLICFSESELSTRGLFVEEYVAPGAGIHLALEGDLSTYTKYRQLGEYEHGFIQHTFESDIFYLQSECGEFTRIFIMVNNDRVLLIGDDMRVTTLRRQSDLPMYISVDVPYHLWGDYFQD